MKEKKQKCKERGKKRKEIKRRKGRETYSSNKRVSEKDINRANKKTKKTEREKERDRQR